MQLKDIVHGKNYKDENSVIILRRKRYKKIVQISLRRKLLDNAHKDFGHPGIQKTLNLIYLNYYIKKLSKYL